MKIKYLILALSAVIAVTTVGCTGKIPGKVTGGGTIDSSSGIAGDKANFGIVGEQCDETVPAKGHFTYLDKKAPWYQSGGVRMNGPVTSAGVCVADGTPAGRSCNVCNVGQYELEFEYRSTNPNYSGTGTGYACIADGGEGLDTTDTIGAISVRSGPFAGYSVSGQVQGNIQAHACD